MLNLVGGGVRDVHVSVNHLADQIEEHLGDGSRLGCSVTLPARGAGPTAGHGRFAGAASAPPDPTWRCPTLVMNGDLMVQFEPERCCAFHERTGATVTSATRPYQHEVPFGVVETERRRT